MKITAELYEVEVDYIFKYKILETGKYADLVITTKHTMCKDFEECFVFCDDSTLLYEEKCTLYYNGFDLYRQKRNNSFVPVECVYDSQRRTPQSLSAKKLNIQKTVDIPLPEGWIELSDGKVLKSEYGKYKPNLLIIANKPVKFKEIVYAQDFNLPSGMLKILYGRFFTTKSGKQAFEVMEKEIAPHMLLQEDWGGAFNRYRGGMLELPDALYYRRASSNGGGTGYDYAVFPKDWKNKQSIEDL